MRGLPASRCAAALALTLALAGCSSGGSDPTGSGAPTSSSSDPATASPVDVGEPVELDGDLLDANGTTVLTHRYPEPGDRDTAQHLTAYDAATGEERWQLAVQVPADSGYAPGSQVQRYGSAVLGESPQDPVVAPYVEGDDAGVPQAGVTALDPDDGSLQWQWLAPASAQADPPGTGTAPLGVVDGTVVVRTGPPGPRAKGVSTWGLDAGSGAVLWHVQQGLAVVGGTLVAGDVSDLGRSRAAVIDPATGRATWTGPTSTAVTAAAGRWLLLYQGDTASAGVALVDLEADDPQPQALPEDSRALLQSDATDPLVGWVEPADDGGVVLRTVGPDDDEPAAAPLDADRAEDLGALAYGAGDRVASQYLEGVWLLGRDGTRLGDRVDGTVEALGPDYLVTTTGGSSQDPQVLLHPLG